MKINFHTNRFENIKTDVLILPIFEGMKKLPAALSFLEKHILPSFEILLKRIVQEKKGNKKITVYSTHAGFPLIILLGMGKTDDWSLEKARQLWGSFVLTGRELQQKKIAVYWDNGYPETEHSGWFIGEAVSALYTAGYSVNEFLTDKTELEPEIEKVDLLYPDAPKQLEKQIKNGIAIGGSINLTRRLAEYPSNLMTPSIFVEEVRHLGKENNWTLEILDEKRLQEKGLGALLAVAQGSENPPYLAIAAYEHPEAKKTIAMVGKGVTFDSGGISIKPSKNMEEMKYDISGAAAVLGALRCITHSKLPLRALAVMPLVENMPSGGAIRPGDIVRSYSGKYIEIINTDAEGRLILADALSYVEKNYQPDIIVDLATLTGSVVVALGHVVAGIMTENSGLLHMLQEAAGISGEKIWQLPLWDEYKEMMKSKIADIPNISNKAGAGTITAAIFLKFFVEKTAWAHLDIAGTAYGMPEKSYRPEGATGFGVKLLWHLARLLPEDQDKKAGGL